MIIRELKSKADRWWDAFWAGGISNPLIVIVELETMLFNTEVIGGRERFKKAFGKQERFGLFIRKLVGLDHNSTKETFAEFLQSHSVTAMQIRFVDYIINYLTLNGVMDIGMFYEKPFTDLNDSGIDGVFQGRDADAMIAIVNGFENGAVVG